MDFFAAVCYTDYLKHAGIHRHGKEPDPEDAHGESLLLVCVTLGVTMTAGTLSGYVLSCLLYERGAYYMAFRFPGIFALAYVCVLTAVPLIVTFASMRSFAGEDLVSRLRGMEN